MINITYALLGFGYAEGSVLGALGCEILSDAYSSEEEALKGLAENLLAIYKDRYCRSTDAIPDCCKENKNKKFCSECGTRISDYDFDPIAFREWLVSLPGLTNDEFGYYVRDDFNWEFGVLSFFDNWSKNKLNTLIIPEQAEDKICEALGINDDGF